MKAPPPVTVLCGGSSEESEVSRTSGREIAQALATHFKVVLVDLPSDQLPNALSPDETVIFPAMHGAFGEDGQLQQILEARGFAYAGSDAASSALCMDKSATKSVVQDSGFSFSQERTFLASSPPEAQEVVATMGPSLVLKPLNEGSSVGLHCVEGVASLERALGELSPGSWMIERWVRGREMTIGLLEGKALGLVEIIPHNTKDTCQDLQFQAVYDYAHKYTVGACEYRYPAEVSEALAMRIRCAAEAAFTACACRDFARIDFILSGEEEPYFLEINTIPGLTPTSLFPKSAHCCDLDFSELARRMLRPAMNRFYTRHL